jgi:hypothetical protein
VTSLESRKCSLGQNEVKFVENTSLNVVYQDIHLHRLNNTGRPSTESAKQNLIVHGAKYQEEFFLNQVFERLQPFFIILPGQQEAL